MRKHILTLIFLVGFHTFASAQIFQPDDYCLVWSDEFSTDGAPNTANWRYEEGCSVRNGEAQYYTNNRRENARVENGKLILEARKENFGDCKYTSASLVTWGKVVYKYGRFEMRAKIDTRNGSWPAFWTLGESGEWPSNGEIDIMEFYNSRIHANVAWGTETRWSAKWDSQSKLVSELGTNWANDFHVWRMEWTPEFINLYVDDILMNTTDVRQTINGSISNIKNPFLQGQYILVNQAIGGNNGGDPSNTTFPIRYEVDYVRVYQKGNCKLDCNWQEGGAATLDNCLRCVGGTTGLTPCVLTCNGNMLTNPGFETGGLANWAGWGTRSASAAAAFSGAAGVQVGEGSLERVVSVQPNTKYTLRAKGRKAGGGGYTLGVKESGAAETFVRKDNNVWQDIEHTFTTGNSTTARIYFYNPDAGTAYGDDFNLQQAGCFVTSLSDENTEIQAFNLFPNPSNNSFELTVIEAGNLEIYTSTGTLLDKVAISETIKYGDNLQSGTYFIHYKSENTSKVFTWVKL